MSALRNAVQSAGALRTGESAALDPRFQLKLEPSVIYGMNSQLFMDDFRSPDWTESAVRQLRDAGIANDLEDLKTRAEERGLVMTQDEKSQVIAISDFVRKKGERGQLAMERVRGEDGMGVPAIAILVLVVAVAVFVVIIQQPMPDG